MVPPCNLTQSQNFAPREDWFAKGVANENQFSAFIGIMGWFAFLGRSKPRHWLAGFLFAVAFLPGARGMVLYASNFNDPPFVPASYWAGVDGWQGSDPSNGTMGVTQSGGSVYLGFVAPASATSAAMKPFSFDPVASKLPIIKIYATLAIGDSTNAHYDGFVLGIFNGSDRFLGGLLFDNLTLGLLYNDGKGYLDMPGKFVNNAFFQVTLTFDFSTGLASAALRNPGASEIVIYKNRPFNVSGSTLNLGAFDVMWLLNDTANPGDNFVELDALRVEALAAPKLSIDKGLHHRSRGATYRLRGRQAAEDAVTVQVRAPGARAWMKAKGRPQRWSYPLKHLESGRNIAKVRLLNLAGDVIDTKRVTIVRR